MEQEEERRTEVSALSASLTRVEQEAEEKVRMVEEARGEREALERKLLEVEEHSQHIEEELAATERRATEASAYVAHLEATVETGTAHADELLQEGKVLLLLLES